MQHNCSREQPVHHSFAKLAEQRFLLELDRELRSGGDLPEGHGKQGQRNRWDPLGTTRGSRSVESIRAPGPLRQLHQRMDAEPPRICSCNVWVPSCFHRRIHTALCRATSLQSLSGSDPILSFFQVFPKNGGV